MKKSVMAPAPKKLVFYSIIVLSLSGLGFEAYAKAPAKAPALSKADSYQAGLDWLRKPGVKAIIYTELDPDKFMTIDSDEDGLLRFKSCECNQPPNCPDLLAPFFSFTPEELMAAKKQSSFMDKVEMVFGIFFIAAPSVPGLPNPYQIISNLPTAGNAINPEAIFQQDMKDGTLGKGIAKAIHDSEAKGSPIGVIKTGGQYSDILTSFRNFLIYLKNRRKADKTRLTAEEKQYYEDVAAGKIKIGESCDEQLKDENEQLKTEMDEVLTQLKGSSIVKPSKAADVAPGAQAQSPAPEAGNEPQAPSPAQLQY